MMKRKTISIVTLFAVLGVSLVAAPGLGQDEPSNNSQNAASKAAQETAKRSDFVSEASFVVGTFVPAKRDHSPAAIESAAKAFLDSLSESLGGRAQSQLTTPVRREWTNLPARPNADGVRMGELDSAQVKLACSLMANLFSEQGFNKIRDIMLADDQLLDGGRPRPGFGTENFSVVIFGEPSATKPWAFQIDGHHVGVNVAVEGEALTMSPSFIGTQPQAFSIAGKKYRPFEYETDLAHKLVMSFSDDQIKQAVLGPQRAEIVTGPGKDNFVPKAKGVPCSTFDESQKKVLMQLISQWVGDLPPAQAKKRMNQIESEFDQMKLSWNGGREPKSDMSYTIQSPSLIIEYACQDLGGDPLNHLHSIYRDPTNEYGKQIQ